MGLGVWGIHWKNMEDDWFYRMEKMVAANRNYFKKISLVIKYQNFSSDLHIM